jgi:hypothetical protein
MKLKMHIFISMILMASATFAEVTVKTEQLNPADRMWKFKSIPGPSKTDIAQGATVTVTGNQWEPSAADGAALVNGRVPNDSLDLIEEALFSNANGNDGTIVIDLGRVQPVAAVTSYSWHENPPDQGCRGPQVYTLFGWAGPNSPHLNPLPQTTGERRPDPLSRPTGEGQGEGSGWIKLADVDTRPNTTGQKWNGQYGVFISDTAGKLGEFRYLRCSMTRG